MDFTRTFPVRYFLNLGRRADRRATTEWNLFEAGVEAERFPAIDARFVKAPRGYEHGGRYALALTQRLAIRRARQQKAESILLFEDDVVLHPNFLELVERINLPDDWGMFFFGCVHEETPVGVADGLVKVNYAVDCHAVAIRSPYFNRVIEALNLHGKPHPGFTTASDRVLAALQKELPTYAAFPNLAWQAETKSDLMGVSYTRYGPSGVAKSNLELTRRCLADMGAETIEPRQARLGLLFLTRADLNHPAIWREWIDQSPERVRIFSHVKDRERVERGILAGAHISRHFQTSWGELGLVQASRALLQEALQDPALTHFVLLSESCVPIRPLADVLHRIDLDPRPQFQARTLAEASERKRSRIHEAPGVRAGCWRFQSQWWLLDRTAAVMATRNDHTPLMAEMAVPDEAYFATVLTMEGYPVEDLVFPEPCTWAHWENGAGSPTSHPRVTPEHLRSMIRSHAIFARKFPPGADIGAYQLHQPASRESRDKAP